MQKIDNIEIKNFKSIRSQKIEGCKRVNVFIGYPNVGKSNILEAIGLFSSFLQNSENFKFSDICRIKNFSELFFNKDYREATNIIINNNLLLELIITQSNDLAIRIATTFDHDGNADRDSIYSSEINNDNFTYKTSIESSESNYKRIVGTIRKYEFKSNGKINQRRPFTLGIPFGDNLLDILQRDSTLRQQVANLFDEYNLKLFLDGEEIKFLKFLNDGTGVSISYHLVADTLRRLIFYKAAIQNNTDSILLFEEPEAHMFPPYISKFTSDLIHDENNNQFFITTHSPFVLNDLIDNLKSDELSIYIVTYKKETGETILNRMSEEDIHEAYQFGYDFFMNLDKFISQEQHDEV
ncbi:MAG: AAA family ATPase [Ginsengibacter sp.]